MTTNATSDTRTDASGPATDTGLGLIAYRPGATPNTPDLVLYAVITVRGQLTIVASAPRLLHFHNSSGTFSRLCRHLA